MQHSIECVNCTTVQCKKMNENYMSVKFVHRGYWTFGLNLKQLSTPLRSFPEALELDSEKIFAFYVIVRLFGSQPHRKIINKLLLAFRQSWPCSPIPYQMHNRCIKALFSVRCTLYTEHRSVDRLHENKLLLFDDTFLVLML